MNVNNKSEYLSEEFTGVDFSDKEIDSVEFENCTFLNCNFSESTLRSCNFVDCEFSQCNLSNVKLRFSKFSDVVFRDSKLVGVNWTEVAWPRFIFHSPIKMYSSIVSESSFYGLSLKELVLDGCKAHNVDFRAGDFSDSDFTYTDFSGSMFGKTTLNGADFSEATDYEINVYENSLEGAKMSRFEAVRLLESLDIEIVD